MSDSYIIEVDSQTAGIVVRSQGGYCFFASSSTASTVSKASSSATPAKPSAPRASWLTVM
ncbi:hypothetical protein ACVWXL_001172 [Bradyrhizobium sp. GM22.5]